MEKQYEAPQLILIAPANEVVMGSGIMGMDGGQLAAPDFEFEQD